jgi:hypothetical protein
MSNARDATEIISAPAFGFDDRGHVITAQKYHPGLIQSICFSARGVEQLQAQEPAEIVWHGSPTQVASGKLNDRIALWHDSAPECLQIWCAYL